MATKNGRDVGGDADGNIVVSPAFYAHLHNCEMFLNEIVRALDARSSVVVKNMKVEELCVRAEQEMKGW